MAGIDKIFNETANVIIEMSTEVEELSKKYGESSKLVLKRSEQLAALIQFYDSCQTEINISRRALHLARIVSDFKDLAIMKYETGLSWKKVFKLNKIGNEEGAKSLDDFDAKFKKFVEDNERLIG